MEFLREIVYENSVFLVRWSIFVPKLIVSCIVSSKFRIFEPKIDRDSSSPTNSMRSTSPDLKVFWPQQTKNKTELYHQLQLQQQLKLKQQHLLTPGMMIP